MAETAYSFQFQPQFAETVDAERARSLRRRVAWYCIVMLFLVLISFVEGVSEYLAPPDKRPPSEWLLWDMVQDVYLLILHACGLAMLVARPWTRAQIVRTLSWLAVLTGAVLVVTTPLVSNESLVTDAIPDQPGHYAFRQQWVTLMGVFVVHFIASFIVALSPREGLRLLSGLVCVVAVGALSHDGLTWQHRFAVIVMAPFLGLPGFLWSVWRYRGFTDSVLHREVSARYGEMASELAQARQVHEALFPPPVTRGGLRVDYRYEPMRDIGGDFLFMYPLSFPPTSVEKRLSIVLIDVTGHGVSAALAVNRLYVELVRFFSSRQDATPLEVIRCLNASTYESLAPQGVYATAVCLRVDSSAPPGEGRLEWCSAGHPPALLRSADGRVAKLDPSATMLGIMEPAAFDATMDSMPFGPGDVAVAFTDGASEAESRRGDQLGIDGLVSRVASWKEGESGGLAEALMQAVTKHRAGPTRDDILILELRAVRADGAESSE